ncbi:uncharacterized protein LOC111644041 [Copidosoma floridanum]|uniref:uncharacterized protein LOC111644041 n=1 Tax=Copidosoma floridanum TaxID=29053 RepID=UPI000C6F4F9E|nr:uncharacterized protein LOC111644041 [Copidosoma floridanum]
MVPVALRKLTSMQAAREAEIKSIHERLIAKPRESLTRDIVKARLDAIKEVWTEARKTNADIVIRDDVEADAYITDKWFERMQGVYEGALDEMLMMLAPFEKDADSSISDAGSESRVARLPRLPLPTFSGAYEEWASFCDLFTSLVHNDSRLSDATKLQYLKLCLTGGAAELIRDVSTTNANYVGTWKALRTRYNNPRLIVNKLLRSFMEIPSMRVESATAMRAFVDESQRIVRALENLQLPVRHWDVWLVFLLADRLDAESRKLWEAELSARDLEDSADGSPDGPDALNSQPKYSDLVRFLEKRAQALGMISTDRKAEKRPVSGSAPAQARKVFHAGATQQSASSRCLLCSGAHPLWKCTKMKEKAPHDRYSTARRLQACFNCLGSHKANACPSSGRCTSCGGKHHSMLHLKPPGKSERQNSSGSQQQGSGGGQGVGSRVGAAAVALHASAIATLSRGVLLATARVTVVGPAGDSTVVCALLDQGSEASFVSESVVQLLGLSKERVCVALSGLGTSSVGIARATTELVLKSSTDEGFAIRTSAFVLPRLTTQLPAKNITDLDLRRFTGFKLADPEFFISKKIDLILGADVYGQLLRPGLERLVPSRIVMQNTAFGWIVSGGLHEERSRRAEQADSRVYVQALHCAASDELERSLKRFWELEDLPVTQVKMKLEDEACEKIFKETHGRDADGRYVVRLPWKADLPSGAAETRRMAVGSLSSMYRRFARDPQLAHSYQQFMTDYERLGHMTRVPDSEVREDKAWYLPHHAVVQSTTADWKLRVVFDASRRTRDGLCLNGFLHTGAPLQRDLSLVLLNWRRYLYVFTADIVKMFRQIRVKPEDQDRQRIVWAPNPDSVPRDYRLTTVTYGTACAPFLAIRTLLQLTEDEGSRFPLGAACLSTETYVDDTFAGADELTDALQKRNELVKLLGCAGISLDKWAANHPELIPPRLAQEDVKQIDEDQSVKTLGVHWSPAHDQFRFSCRDVAELSAASTKRTVLSNIARLFDPLGWLSPVTVGAKILMQDLWIQKCDWDSPLPAEIRERWYEYCKSLANLPSLAVDRWLGVAGNCSLQIHGFSDASSRAFAAAVYLRVDGGDRHIKVSLLAAKTKVAPVKTVSIPNLELCGAALLVRLIGHLMKLDFLKTAPVFAWSDSQIVLMWLRRHPCSWKTFVANRVSFIQTELPSATWRHVPTKENPADLATRGADPIELAENGQWWHGPRWLAEAPEQWPEAAESRRVAHVRQLPSESDLLTRFSSLTRLIRVVAYCRRPMLILRGRKKKMEPFPPFLTASELADSRKSVIKLSQDSSFAGELKLLREGKSLPKRGRLSKLNPFLDRDGILRVGGRLEHSTLSFESKHPSILAQNSNLSLLFTRYAHQHCLHGGPTLTSSLLMQHVWILGRNKLVKTVVRKCLICQRVKPQSTQQLMGELPADRVTAGRPFLVTGLDYAGPIQVRATKGRGHKSYKGYIVVFVCFSTRAIHLELVSDLTSASFLSAYRRFVGRRGVCRKLYSDNATNFHGADTELASMFQRASEFYNKLAPVLANDGTDWNFIPPSAPHYGGLWEAGVKSVKHHLKRVVGEHMLTFEELSTVLVEIEACLNSRPLGALSADVDDLQALTPSHFLHGCASTLLPDANLTDVPQNRLDRYQLLQRIRNLFWKRWSSEYLLHLQQREKWREPTENFCVGRLVLVKDDRYPPSKWPLGRVTDVHPGPDGLVRVVTVKTATTSLRRHVARVCPLYMEKDTTTM